MGGTGVPAAVGDQVTMYLDVDANEDFPESINGIIQHPIVSTQCGTAVSYSVEYDEADLEGAVTALRPQDVIDTVLVTQGDILVVELAAETAARIAADSALTTAVNLKAPLASPTFTGTVTIPAIVAPIVGITGTKLQFQAAMTDDDFGTLGGTQTYTGQKTFSNGIVTSDVLTTATVDVGTDLNVNGASNFVNFSSSGTGEVAGTLTLFGPIVSFSQALSGAGAVNTTALTTKLTSTGVAQALTLADGVDGQIKTIVHVVDGGSSVLTPTTKTGYTTITFTDVGETATLQFFTTVGWLILSLRGAVAA